MDVISKMHVLIHPDYHAMYDIRPDLGLHPYQIGLRLLWKERIQAIKEDPNVALFYVSVLEEDDLRKGLEDSSSLPNQIQKQDVDRIKQWQDMLKERFFVYPNHVPITSEMIQEEARGREIIIDTKHVELFVFGEYEGGGITCVESWGYRFKRELGVSDSRYRIDKTLSFSVDKIRPINEWQIFRRGKEF